MALVGPIVTELINAQQRYVPIIYAYLDNKCGKCVYKFYTDQ